MEQGFYFIFLITDACSRKIIGYHVSLSMDGTHALTALHMAMRNNDHALHGIIHLRTAAASTVSHAISNLLKEQGMLVSMTENSDPRDNAIAERVNGILKNELLAHHKVQNIAQAKALLHEAVSIYNEERPHLSCNMLKPSEAHTMDHSLQRRWRTSD